MEELTPEERRKIQDLTDIVAKGWSKLKKHGEFVAVSPTVKHSGSVSFSDTGNDNGLLPELAPERQEAAFNDIRRLSIAESVRATIKQYLESRNKAIRAGKKNAKANVSRPFQFRQHDYKD